MFKIKAGRFQKRHSFIQLELAGNLKTLFNFKTFIVMQAALSACLTVRLGDVDGSCSNPREFHSVGVCVIDRTGYARAQSKL